MKTRDMSMRIKPGPDYESLFRLAETLAYQDDIDELIRLTVEHAVAQTSATTGSMLLVNPSTQNTVKTINRIETFAAKNYRLVHENVTGWILAHSRTFHTKDLRSDSRFDTSRLTELKRTSVIAVPLISEGASVGCLLTTNEETVFEDYHLQYLERLGFIATPYIVNAKSIEDHFLPKIPDSALIEKYEMQGMYGKSEPYVKLLRLIDAATACDAKVLIEGQSGTGKELVARAIHKLSARATGPFMAIDCGAIPKDLIESELFGSVKGAFTGAHDRKGLFLTAEGGTLFLDEIANLPYDMQSKLLRVLQEKEVRPVGSDQTYPVDVRIIAACSKPLTESLKNGAFREDLYYRLFVYPIRLPTLQERRADIPILANYFLSEHAKQQTKPLAGFSPSLVSFMKSFNWAGNVRQLENFVERLVTLAPKDVRTISAQYLPPDIRDEYIKGKQSSVSLEDQVNRFEAQLIRQVLIDNEWNQSQAARDLRTSEATVRYKIRKLGIWR